MKPSINARSWTNSEGVEYKLPGDPIWTSAMGSRIALVDIDTRGLDGPGEIMSPGPLYWENLTFTSAGMMGHYLYSMYFPNDERYLF